MPAPDAHLRCLLQMPTSDIYRDARLRCLLQMPTSDAFSRCPRQIFIEMPASDACSRCPPQIFIEMPASDAYFRCPPQIFIEMPNSDAYFRCPSQTPTLDTTLDASTYPSALSPLPETRSSRSCPEIPNPHCKYASFHYSALSHLAVLCSGYLSSTSKLVKEIPICLKRILHRNVM